MEGLKRLHEGIFARFGGVYVGGYLELNFLFLLSSSQSFAFLPLADTSIKGDILTFLHNVQQLVL